MDTRQQFDDYDPRAWLERSGLLFLQRGCYAASIGAFTRLIRVEPTYSMAWYGLASATYCSSGQRQDLSLLGNAVSCAKRALEVDSTNEMARKLLDAIPKHTPLTQEQVSDIAAFAALPDEFDVITGFVDSTFADAMGELPDHGERIQIVMWLGMLDEPCGTNILLAALSDPDEDVRMAALKRLDAADEDPRIVASVQQLAFSDAGRDSEPYLSMALNRFARAATGSDHWAVRILDAISRDQR